MLLTLKEVIHNEKCNLGVYEILLNLCNRKSTVRVQRWISWSTRSLFLVFLSVFSILRASPVFSFTQEHIQLWGWCEGKNNGGYITMTISTHIILVWPSQVKSHLWPTVVRGAERKTILVWDAWNWQVGEIQLVTFVISGLQDCGGEWHCYILWRKQ